MVGDLRPAATPRVAKFLPGQELNINEEDFVIFESEQSITMGIVMEVDKEECQVHVYTCNEQKSVWLPLWLLYGGVRHQLFDEMSIWSL